MALLFVKEVSNKTYIIVTFGFKQLMNFFTVFENMVN